LQKRARLLFGTQTHKATMLLRIDRSSKFSAKKCFWRKSGHYDLGWCHEDVSPQSFGIWRGPADGDGRKGREEQDSRSLKITTLETDSLSIDNFLTPSTEVKELYRIEPEDLLREMRATGRILADAQIGLTLLSEPEHKTLERIYSETKISWIYFFGTVVRHQYLYQKPYDFEKGRSRELRMEKAKGRYCRVAFYLVRHQTSGFITPGHGWRLGGVPMKREKINNYYLALSFPAK
jgi:hypothetical protein